MTGYFSKLVFRHSFTLLCYLLFIVGVVAYASTSIFLKGRNSQASSPEPVRAFTLTEHEYLVSKDGDKTLNAVITHEVDGNENFTFTRYYVGQDKWEKYEYNGKNVIATNSKGIRSMKEMPPASETEKVNVKMRTESFYLNSPNLAGQEMLLGLIVYKLNETLANGMRMESYHSPKLGRFPLKYIIYRSNRQTATMEAVKLEFK